MENKRIAVIRIHGKTGLKKGIRDTLNMLRLYKKNSCIVITNTKEFSGMINKVKEYVTWGDIDEKTFKLLLEKRGRIVGKKPLREDYLKEKIKLSLDEFTKQVMEFKRELKDLPGLKQFFKLSPPKGGFERGGVKKHFALGGVLGYRKDKINDLIKKMV